MAALTGDHPPLRARRARHGIDEPAGQGGRRSTRRPRPPSADDSPTRHAVRPRRKNPWPQVVVGVTALVLFAWRVQVPGPWRDEAATMAASRRTLAQLLELTRHTDLVHLPFYLVARVALSVQDSVTAVRLVSVIAMAVTAALLAGIARRLGGTVLALTAGAAFLALPTVSRWAQDARPIAMATLVTTVATALLLVAVRTPRRAGVWAGYGAALVLLGLVNVLGLLIVPAHAVYLLLTHPVRMLARALVAWTAAGVCCLPWLVATFGQRGQVSWIEPPHLYDLTALYIHAFGSKAVPVVVVLGGVASLALAKGLPGGGTGNALVLGATWATVPPVLLWVVSLRLPMWDAHYVVFSLPGLALLVAAEIATIAAGLRRRRDRARARTGTAPTAPVRRPPSLAAGLAGTVVVALLAVIGAPQQLGYRTAAGHGGEDGRAVAAYLAGRAVPGDQVLFVPVSLRDISATYPAQFTGLVDVALARTAVAGGTLHGEEATPAELTSRVARAHRVWLVTGDYPARSEAHADVDAAKLAALRSGFRQTSAVTVPGFRIASFERLGAAD